MRWTTLDKIVCSLLLRRGYPVHFYFQFMKLASDCIRELNFSTLAIINTKKLLVGPLGSVELPQDYVDYVKIGIPNGQYVRPLASRDGINRLNNYDDNGNKTLYDHVESNQVGGWIGYWYNNVINSNGENIGRQYGRGAGERKDTFKVLKERGEIQFDEDLGVEYIILEYISDGQNVDNATKIDPQAQATIEAYVLWQMKEASRAYGLQERQLAKQEYTEQWRQLRARLADWTITDILRIVRSAYSIKS